MQRFLLLLLFTVLLPVHVWAVDPAYVSISNTTYASRTNTTVTAPSSISNGNKLILLGLTAAASSAPTATPPAGFAEVAGTWPRTINDGGFFLSVWVWYKVASGESGNYTFTHSSASSQGVMVNISGGSDSQPATSQNNGTNTTTTFSTKTTVNNNALVLLMGTDWGATSNNLTEPTGTTPTFTERLDVALTYVATGILATAGATGNKTMTNNSGVPDPWTGTMIVVEPDGGSPDATPFYKRRWH